MTASVKAVMTHRPILDVIESLMRGSQIIKGARATDGSEVKENDGERNQRYRCQRAAGCLRHRRWSRQAFLTSDVATADNFDGDVVAECQ